MRALGGGKPGGVRLRLGRAAAWFGFGVADRRYRGAGEGGGRLSPAGSGLSPVEASVFYQWFSPGRVSVLHPTSFDDALVLADRFKRRQVVILNLQRASGQLSRQVVDFCAGLAYGLDGEMHVVADQLILLAPREVEVSNEKRERPAERRLFNQY